MGTARFVHKAGGISIGLVALGLLVLAPGAQAAKGVYDAFGTVGTKGGEGGINGVAVNTSGAGGVNPGDVYVLNSVNNRIQQFSAAGKFIRAFGQDVITNAGSPANSNGTGYEICDTTAGNVADDCKAGIAGGTGGAMQGGGAIAVDQITGNLYLADGGFTGNKRIQQFSPTGNFIRAFGKNVVASGSEQADEQQRLTVDAGSGQYKLNFGAGGPGVSETVDIAWNASPATVQSALEGISNIGAGNVAVTKGPGSPGGATPYLISFGATLADTDLAQITVSAGTTPLSGGAATASVASFNEGAIGFEVCTVAANCQASSEGSTGGAFSFQTLGAVAIAPAGAPNAGDVLVAERGNNRVQEFTSTGAFVRAFGWDTVASGPDDNNTGPNEVRSLTVRATAGTYKLIFEGQETAAIPFNAPAATVQGSLNALSSIGGVGGSVTVSGGPGDQSGSSPYSIVFEGALGHRQVGQLFSTESTLSGGQPSSQAVLATITSGGAFEVCRAATLDICKAGTKGSGSGQFNEGPSSIAEDSSGNLYTVESLQAVFRVQKFTLPGNVVTPQGVFDAAELSGTGAWNTTSDTPIAVAVDTSTSPGTPGTLYLLKYFPKGSGSPPLSVREPHLLEVDPVAEKVINTYMTGAEVGTGSSVTSLALNTTSKRLYVPEPGTPIYIIDEVPPLLVTPEAAEAGGTSAVLHASITPAPLPSLHTFYRFEYSRAGTGEWKKAPAPPATDVDIGNGVSPVAVSQTIEGLQVGTTYEVRVVAYSKYKGSSEVVEADPFTTEAVPPILSTGVGRWSSPASTKPSLTLNATINSGNNQTTFFFEYVSEEEFQANGFNSARIAPPLPAQAGHGTINVDVLWSIAGLDPAKTYRYRVVATNSAGTTIGDVRTVTPPDPSDRFYELVSDAESYGIGIDRITAISDDGERVVLRAQAIGDPNSLPAQRTPFLAQRDSGGWGVDPLDPFPESNYGEQGFTGAAWFPADLSTALWAHFSPEEQIHSEVHWTFTDPDGTFREALPKLVPVAGRGTPSTWPRFKGGAADLSSFVFQVENAGTPDPAARTITPTYLPGQPLTTGGDRDLYRVSGAAGPSPTMTLLNYDPTGSLISNSCGVWLGANMNGYAGVSSNANKGLNLRPVSTDGKVAYFSARPGVSGPCNAAAETANRIRVFKRIEDLSTVEVSKSQCTRTVPTPCSSTNGDDFFQAASSDGNRVFLTTTRQLTDTDEDSTLDLYLYDSNPPSGQPTLVQVSAGEVTANHAKVGSGAEVQEGVVDASPDGSRVYFVAKGQLTPAASKGASNLFVYQRDGAHPTGRIAFIAKLDGADSALWGTGTKPAFALPFYGPDGKAPGDGHFLLFSSKAKLLAADTDTAADLYRYDDEGPGLICLTCQGNGNFDVAVRPHGSFAEPTSPQSSRVASEDLSTVAFATKESLSGADQNTVADAYLWHEGTISLISPGNAGSAGLALEASSVISPTLSADGSAAYFLTADRILAPDHNSAWDAYSARIGGGFPEAEQEQSCISAAECRSAPTAAPGASSPPSASFSGPGNQAQPPSKCAKGKVKKKGRCVKRSAVNKSKHKKKRKHQRQGNEQRAHNDRGGKR